MGMYELHSLVDLSPYHQDEVVFGIGISAIEELNSLLSPDVCKRRRRREEKEGGEESRSRGGSCLIGNPEQDS